MDKRGSWNREELKRMLTRLTSVPTMKSIFFIDALDECEPQDALSDLADEILWISRLPNVKLCVSCRPWNAFVRKFDASTTLRIDLLTYRDMEKYVEARLRSAEAECDFQDDFRAGTPLARQVIYDIAGAAEGVFLWVELVTKALCSELRKGSNIEQLRQVVSEFPADLDDYFHTLIFDRIGKTKRNVLDTAAALKLASEIMRHKGGVPFPQSYMNFWLLSQGYLRSGFSWNDHDSVRHLPIEHTLRIIKSFLEETCKDLLVLSTTSGEDSHFFNDWKVDYFHRTIFDFLNDTSVKLNLDRDSPQQFSEPGFILDLAKFRCVCLFREEDVSCRFMPGLLDDIIQTFEDSAPLDICAEWLAACESSMITQTKANCDCRGLDHSPVPFMNERCMKVGLERCLLETIGDLPFQALLVDKSSDLSLLDCFLHVPLRLGTNDSFFPSLEALRQILECGCDPNKPVKEFVGCRPGCQHTRWEAWLGGVYRQLQQYDSEPERIRLQERTIAAVVDLLLSYGADPHCMPCIADHDASAYHSSIFDRPQWRRISLDELLPLLIPTECFSRPAVLRATYSDTLTISTLRRNQYRRAIRSFVTSERNIYNRNTSLHPSFDYQWQHSQQRFLASLIGLSGPAEYASCRCSRGTHNVGLIAWCIDCRSLSSLCSDCCQIFSHDDCVFEPPCKALQGSNEAVRNGHTSIAVASRCLEPFGFGPKGWMLRYSVAQALTVLKEWYARNPI